MAQLSEEDILNAVYEIREGDDTHWAATDSEYITGRGYCNVAIGRWEFYDNTEWRSLWTPSSDSSASDATLTITAGTYSYSCPANMRFPGSYVRTIRDGVSTYFKVVDVEKVGDYDDTASNWCYFTGSVKDGFTLHFNPSLTLTTADTIAYEYYKQATRFTVTTSKTELEDPYFIVNYVLSLFYESDGEDGKSMKALQLAEDKLEGMRVRNIASADSIIPSEISVDENSGFGY